MSYPASDRSPVSPSFTANPFDKYKNARAAGGFPAGLGGIGTGSSDRFSSRRKVGERKRIARVLAAAALVGFLLWFWISPTEWPTSVTRSGGLKGNGGPIAGTNENLYDAPVPHQPIDVNAPVKAAGGGSHGKQQIGKEKASFVMLIRNQELRDALRSMKQMEDRFNKNYHYPWTFLNDVEFTEEFINATTAMASGKTEYGIIPKEHWSIPEAIDQDKMKAAMKKMEDQKVIYGGSTSYRHMCRFNSGFFFRQELLAKYEWYWRVEPGIGFYCDVEYDPFEFMRLSGKKYGFTITLPEYITTIPTLWPETLKFMKENPKFLAGNSSLQYLLTDNDQGKTLDSTPPPEYNNCHFWSNFEIASLDFWRGEAYTKYFDHLDKAGGFFYERWGDAPVHSIGAALFLNTQEIHHFADMGYYHGPWSRCPQPDEFHKHAKCVCPFELKESFDLNGWSCQPRWWKVAGKEYGS